MPRGGVRAAKFRFFHLAPASALTEDPEVRWARLRLQHVIYLHGRQIRENWYHDTGGGTCSTHTPLGEYLYAVSIASQKQEAARALFIASRRTFIRSHVYQTVIFGRLPRFRKWVESQGYAPETLNRATKRRLLDIYVNTLHDPYQVFYEGMNFMAEYGVVDYLEGDDESLNCALKLVWRNPYYKPLMLNRAVAEIVEPVPAVR